MTSMIVKATALKEEEKWGIPGLDRKMINGDLIFVNGDEAHSGLKDILKLSIECWRYPSMARYRVLAMKQEYTYPQKFHLF